MAAKLSNYTEPHQSLTYRAGVDDPARFTKPKSVGAFFGLTPTRAHRFSTLKRWALDVAKRRGMRRAKVALARKHATVLHRMWADGTEFTCGKDPAAATAA